MSEPSGENVLPLVEKFSIGACIRRGFGHVPDNFLTQLACTVALIAVMVGMQSLSRSDEANRRTIRMFNDMFFAKSADDVRALQAHALDGGGDERQLLITVAPFLVIAPLFVGMSFVFLKIKRRQATSPLDMRKGLDRYFTNVGVYLIKTTVQVVPFLVFTSIGVGAAIGMRIGGADPATGLITAGLIILPGLVLTYTLFVLFILSPFVLAESRIGVFGTLIVTAKITARRFAGMCGLVGIFTAALGIPLLPLMLYGILSELGMPLWVPAVLALTLTVSVPVAFSGAAHAYECLKMGRTPEEILEGKF